MSSHASCYSCFHRSIPQCIHHLSCPAPTQSFGDIGPTASFDAYTISLKAG